MQENLASANPIYTLEEAVRQAQKEQQTQQYAIGYKEHSSNKSPSKLEKHQNGSSRHKMDANRGEKGDKRREDRSNKRRNEQIVPTPKDAVPLKDIEDLPTLEFDWNISINIPNTGDKPIYEKVWDEFVHMFDEKE